MLIGLTHEPVQLSTSDVVRRGLTLVGSIIYDHPQDFADTAQAVAGGLRPELAVQEGFTPERAAEAFADARTVPGKSWIDLTGW